MFRQRKQIESVVKGMEAPSRCTCGVFPVDPKYTDTLVLQLPSLTSVTISAGSYCHQSKVHINYVHQQQATSALLSSTLAVELHGCAEWSSTIVSVPAPQLCVVDFPEWSTRVCGRILWSSTVEKRVSGFGGMDYQKGIPHVCAITCYLMLPERRAFHPPVYGMQDSGTAENIGRLTTKSHQASASLDLPLGVGASDSPVSTA